MKSLADRTKSGVIPSLLLAGSLLCVSLSGSAGIAVTKHNLTGGGSEGRSMTSICIFCHTPIGDPSTGINPAWEKNSGSTSFAMFDDIGRFDPNREITGSVSTACLSCHDGAQAANVTALTFDHPYGVPYRGAVIDDLDIGQIPRDSTAPDAYVSLVNTTSTTPKELQATVSYTGFRAATSEVIDNAMTWWIETGGSGRQRTDIKLYARHFGDGVAVPYIECASCHDPHADTQTFLRIANSRGNRLCLGCHEI